MKIFILISLFLLPITLLNAQIHYTSIVIDLSAQTKKLTIDELKNVNIVLKHEKFDGGEVILTHENTTMEFQLPSADPDEVSSAQIILSLKLSHEGEYTYEVDASNIDEESDELTYQGHFRLGQSPSVKKEEAAISNFSSYPNPFSSPSCIIV